jgi:hypothetical protein
MMIERGQEILGNQDKLEPKETKEFLISILKVK